MEKGPLYISNVVQLHRKVNEKGPDVPGAGWMGHSRNIPWAQPFGVAPMQEVKQW